MTVIQFIEQHPDLVGIVVSAIGGLIWHTNKQSVLSDTWDTMLKIGRQILPQLLKDARLYDDAYVLQKIKDAIWAGLDRLKVKRTPTIEQYVNEAAEHIKGELAEKLTDYHLGQIIKTEQQTLDVIKTMPPAPAVIAPAVASTQATVTETVSP